jgi:hypothetical protein
LLEVLVETLALLVMLAEAALVARAVVVQLVEILRGLAAEQAVLLRVMAALPVQEVAQMVIRCGPLAPLVVTLSG